jgi:hypothetical protein
MLMIILMSIFLILHGLVHLLYAGQSWRLFELRPAMLWPDGSWLFSRLLGDGATRYLASIALLLAALGFVAGGLGLLLRQDWWRPATIGAAVFSSAIFILLWDGKFQALAEKGAVALMINIAILIIVMAFKWPA